MPQKLKNTILQGRATLYSTFYLFASLLDSLLLLAASFVCTCTLTSLLAFRLSTQHSTLGLPEVDTILTGCECERRVTG